MRMTLATKASRWKMYFFFASVPRIDVGSSNVTYCAHLDTVLVEGRPFDDFGLEGVVNLWYQFEGQGLSRSACARVETVVKKLPSEWY